MTAPTHATVPGVDMSWERFLALPDDTRAEYSAGKAIVNPPPSFTHQKICLRLRDVLVAQLPAHAVVALAVGWRLPGEEPVLRIPDVLVLDGEPPGDLVTGAPPVAIEVLSTNRTDDTVRKSHEYYEAGLGQYWVVDPRERTVDVYARSPAGWDHLAHVADDAPTARVPVPDLGSVDLSLTEVLG